VSVDAINGCFSHFTWYNHSSQIGEIPQHTINAMALLMVSRRVLIGDTIRALSVVAIKAAKGRDRTYKLTDSDGLYLLVT